jgi:putative ABC transport system permease protein
MAARIGPVEKATAVANTHAQVHRSDLAPPEDTSGVTVLAAKTNLLDVPAGTRRPPSCASTATRPWCTRGRPGAPSRTCDRSCRRRVSRLTPTEAVASG